MQILHSPDHWLLITKGLLNTENTRVYDSLDFRRDQRKQILAGISSLVRAEENKITFEVMPCQRQQNGSNDCGILAIAFATALAFGLDPSMQFFYSSASRKHLSECF